MERPIGSDNLYDSILDIFIDPMMRIIKEFVTNQDALIALGVVFNGFFVLTILIFAGRAIKEGDMFNWQTLVPNVARMVFIAGITNYALMNPEAYYRYFFALIELPQEIIMPFMEKSSSIIATETPMIQADGRAGLPALVTKIVETIGFIWDRMVVDEISIWGGLGKTLVFALLCLIISVLQFTFLALLIFIVVSTTVEILIWGALSVPLLPLVFFKETLGSYMQFVKKLISLSLFKPLVLFVALLDVYALEFIIFKLPKNADNLSAIDQGGLNPFVAFLIMFLLSMICILILQKIPDMINALTGHYNNSATVAQATNMIMKGAGKMLASAGFGGKAMQEAYKNGGGGLGGLVAMAGTFWTGGLAKKQSEGAGRTTNSALNNMLDRLSGRKTGITNTRGGGK